MKFCQNVKKILPLLRDPSLVYIYILLRDYTMISVRKYIANLKLARSAAAIPGAIVECGTWKGGMIAGIARLYGENREYYLFDSFEGLPKVEAIDGSAARSWQENTESPGYHDNCRASTEDALAAMSIAKISNPHLIKGWFEDTLPQAIIPGGIAILRMDADWYKSTYQILDSLFPQVIAGGLVIIDDYYTWDGCSKAVHDYLSEHKRPERICSFEGVCFIRKKADQD